MKLVKNIEKDLVKNNVSDKEAEEAFKKILKWIGEDPDREGLVETPKRLVKAFKEYFGGYDVDAKSLLSKTFGDVEGYDDMVIQKNISLQSHCEHHMAPIIGVVHVAYIPKNKVVDAITFIFLRRLISSVVCSIYPKIISGIEPIIIKYKSFWLWRRSNKSFLK